MSEKEIPLVACSDGCGAKCPVTEIEDRIWEWLSVSNRYRCPECRRALRQAAGLVGTDAITPDNLPPDSRGALPKETASTISAPTVR
jgi:hypothetical protein